MSVQLTLSTEQDRAVQDIVRWWKQRSQARQGAKQTIFTVAGYAGTGKSTVVSAAVDALNLDPLEVRYVCYTGKAALVLTRKGCPASTIHSLIYTPVIRLELDEFGRERERVIGFRLKKRDELLGISLLVLDEVSMVSAELLSDLASFGVPMLALGDPEQLPPVQATGHNLLVHPDAFLQQVHRQAANNPILWASMQVRQGNKLAYGQYGSNLIVMPRNHLTQQDLLAADQVLVGKNATRRYLNDTMRLAQGYSGLPRKGEKLISLKNNWDEVSTGSDPIPLINGWIGRLTTDVKTKHINKRKRTLRFDSIQDWDAPHVLFRRLDVNLDYFDPQPGEEPHSENGLNNFDYGYAITTHKSQGSEWNHVLYIHEPFGGSDTRRQLMYTGITRASDRLLIVI